MNIFKNQKILITGGTGMVGIALTKLLLDLEANITVVTLDDFNPFEDMTAEQHLEWLQKLSWKDLVEATCTDETYSLEEYMENWK